MVKVRANSQTTQNKFIISSFILGALLIIILNKYYKASIQAASLVIGGLGLFIYGMRIMSEGLQEIAGDKLRKTLKFLTGNRIGGVLTGLGITAIVQSSSATTVMVVGFVNSGLMTLMQSASVIIGANVGTTITGQLIAFNLKVLALPAIAVGSALYIFSKKDRIKLIGKVTLGFGILFFAMSIMSAPLKELRHNPQFRNLFIEFSSNPLLGLFAGTILTVIVQSSSVTVAITMSLASAGLISFSASIPIILGDNIGTTITAILASIGTNLAAKRAAIVHSLFNVLGAVVILIFLSPYIYLIDNITEGNVPINNKDINSKIEYLFKGKKVTPFIKTDNGYIKYTQNMPNEYVYIKYKNNYMKIEKSNLSNNIPYIMRHVANAHTFFNIVNMLIWLPLLGVLTWAAKKIWPGDEKLHEEGEFVKHIDKRMLQTPPIAVAQIQDETTRMFKICNEMLVINQKMLIKYENKLFDELYKKEKIVNMLENAIAEYSFLLFDKDISEKERDIVNYCLNIIHEIERIGDHCFSIGESFNYKAKNNVDMTKEAIKELKDLFSISKIIMNAGISVVNTKQSDLIYEIKNLEEKIDSYKDKYRKKHIKRTNKKMCNPSAGIIYMDTVNNLERLSDHVYNIANLINE